MAIEDAMVLTRHLVQHTPVPDALQSYERARGKRTAAIVNQSWSFGALVKWKNPIAVRMRELLVRATPEFLVQQTMRKQIGFDAGNLS